MNHTVKTNFETVKKQLEMINKNVYVITSLMKCHPLMDAENYIKDNHFFQVNIIGFFFLNLSICF